MCRYSTYYREGEDPWYQPLGNHGGNSVRHNEAVENDVGIWIAQGARHSLFVKNLASRDAEHGIYVEDRSTPHEAGTGANAFVTNRANHNGKDGIHLRQSGENLLVRNVARANSDDGIEVVRADDNLLVANVVCDNADEQLIVSSDSAGNWLRANDTEC